MRVSISILAAGMLVQGIAGAEDAASFAFGMKECPATRVGPRGALVTWDDIVTLKTLSNTQSVGPQGWSLSLVVEGGDATIDISGVKVDTVYDEKDGKTQQVIHHDSYLFDLGEEADFSVAEAGRGGLAADGTDGGLPAAAKGVLATVVLKQQDPCALQPAAGLSFDVARVTCTAKVPADGTAGTFKLSFRDGLIPAASGGQPAANLVVEVVTDAGGKEAKGFAPATTGCAVLVQAPVPVFHYILTGKGSEIAASNDIVRDVCPGDITVDVEVRLTSENVPDPDGPKGWSISLANESCMSTVIENSGLFGVKVHTIYDQKDKKTGKITHHDDYLLDVGAEADFAAFADSTGDYVGSTLPPGIGGVTCGVVLKNQEHCVLFPSSRNPQDPILQVQYKLTVTLGATTNCGAYFLNGLLDKQFASVPDTPYIENTVTLDVDKAPTSFTPTFSGLFVKLVAYADLCGGDDFRLFIRGNVNGQIRATGSRVDLADVITIVQHIVDAVEFPLGCPEAADLDRDGNITVSDALYLIDFLFLGGAPPPAPFPGCDRSPIYLLGCNPDYSGCW